MRTKSAGLTLARRKVVAAELAASDAKAMEEAQEKYPTDTNRVDARTASKNAPKCNDYYDESVAKYEAQVCQKYHIDADQMLAIMVEAYQEGWPSAPLQ